MPRLDHREVLEIASSTEEFEVWQRDVLPRLGDLPENVLNICAYGFTEMLNNVIDHSESPDATLALEWLPDKVRLSICDRGVGIFAKIQSALGLANEHDALLELAKGGLTTDPQRHTGEGIFFTARMFDDFSILSGTMYVSFNSDGNDWVIEEPHLKQASNEGTMVTMSIDPESKRTTREVFDRAASKDGERAESITRTHLAVRLAQPGGEPLVSRSQAKRVLARLEQFEEAILDFRGVPEIGPAFADEMFRVFAASHPSVRLIPVDANEQVMRMIIQAQTRAPGVEGSEE